MSEKGENTFIAILMGAQEYPQHKALNNPAFGFSNDAVLKYLQDGLQLRAEQILNLFDDPSNVIDFDDRISNFLDKNQNSRNIIIFYVGHGGFLADREYYLVIRSTRKGKEHTTGLRIKTLAETLSQYIGDKNLFLILDCCFAGEAIKIFQSTELAALVEAKTFDALPEAGTALLVAASKDEPAISPANHQYTMFSETFLNVLREGIPNKTDKLTLHDVATRTQAIIKAKYGQMGVRPEVHSPRQKGVDVAELPIFPNRVAQPDKFLRQPKKPPPDPKLTDLCQFDKIRNEFIVTRGLLTDEYIALVSDNLFDVKDSLAFLDETNKQLKASDPAAVSVRRGNLNLNSTSLTFWSSLFDEASLQGHKTLAILLCLVAQALPVEVQKVAVEAVSNVLKDYHDQLGRL